MVIITTPLVEVADYYFMTPERSQKIIHEFEQQIMCGTKSKFIEPLRSLKSV
jgi:hypothetical protein